MKKTAVLIGRFQPFHKGHATLLKAAGEIADQVLVVLGSANGPRNLRNPFTAAEREAMIRANFPDSSRLQFAGVRDYFYNDHAWVNEVREKVNQSAKGHHVLLIGHHKDFTSNYLSWFKEWESARISTGYDVHATGIRENFFRDAGRAASSPELSEATKTYLAGFAQTETYQTLKTEQLGIDQYKQAWAAAPFPPTFVTTDAVVLCAGHVLLIQRKKVPGKGQWALPGGFLDPHERIFDCVLRELDEETKIQVPKEELTAAFKKVQVFDHPLRSSRGRTLTHAHLFELEREKLPQITANDDAMNARWLPLMDVAQMEDKLFEDHFHVIHRLTKAGAKDR